MKKLHTTLCSYFLHIGFECNKSYGYILLLLSKEKSEFVFKFDRNGLFRIDNTISDTSLQKYLYNLQIKMKTLSKQFEYLLLSNLITCTIPILRHKYSTCK